MGCADYGLAAIIGLLSLIPVYFFFRRPFHTWMSRSTKEDIPDPSFGDPVLAKILNDEGARQAVQTKRLVEQSLQGDRSAEAGWDAWEYYASVLAGRLPLEQLDAWCRREPNHPQAFGLRGRRRIYWAWEARTAMAADNVSDGAFSSFFDRLELAAEDLQRATQLDEQDPMPHAWQLLLARGLQFDREYAEAAFLQATTRDPANWEAHKQMQQYLAAKWFGSHEDMFQFTRWCVRERAAQAPDLAALLMAAHIERSLDEHLDGDYLERRDVREEVLELYRQTMAAPHYRPRRTSLYAWNVAACWFFLTQDRTHLPHAWSQVEGKIADFPWSYIGIKRSLKEIRFFV